MINPLRNFTKKKIGGLILIFVIIVAFGLVDSVEDLIQEIKII